MFRTPMLVAACAGFALLGASAAPAQTSALSQAAAQPSMSVSEDQLEVAAEAFEARMKAFEREAEAISEDPSLSDVQKGMRIATALNAYQPDIEAFTALATNFALHSADVALNMAEMTEVVAAATEGVRESVMIQSQMQPAAGSGEAPVVDTDELVTYSLVAQHEIGEALDDMNIVIDMSSPVAPPAPPVPPAPASNRR